MSLKPLSRQLGLLADYLQRMVYREPLRPAYIPVRVPVSVQRRRRR